MLRKIVKYTLRTLIVILLAVLLAPALLYVPAVQDFIRGKAVGYASEALGMDLSVGRIRLAFPLRLTVEETLLIDRADTLVDCGRLSLDVALWPLIRKEVVVRSFELDRIAAHYKDSTGGLEMHLAAGLLSLGETRADLQAQRADIARITLSDGDIFLDLTESAPAEKADSTAPLAWSLDIRKISILNTAFGMHTSPAVTELTVRLADGEIEACRVRLDSQQVDVKSILLDRGAYSYLTAPADPEKEASPRTRTLRRHGALPAVDRTGGQRRADGQPGRVRHAGPPPRRRIRSGTHRPFGPRPYDRLGLQPGLRHRPATSPDEVHRAQRSLRA